MARRSVSLPPNLERTVRRLQATLLTTMDRDISFTETLNLALASAFAVPDLAKRVGMSQWQELLEGSDWDKEGLVDQKKREILDCIAGIVGGETQVSAPREEAETAVQSTVVSPEPTTAIVDEEPVAEEQPIEAEPVASDLSALVDTAAAVVTPAPEPTPAEPAPTFTSFTWGARTLQSELAETAAQSSPAPETAPSEPAGVMPWDPPASAPANTSEAAEENSPAEDTPQEPERPSTVVSFSSYSTPKPQDSRPEEEPTVSTSNLPPEQKQKYDDLAKALEEAAAAYEETLNKPESDRTGS